MATANLTFNLENASTQFQQASVQTQLAVLHYLAKQLRQASKAATPSAFFSQKVQEVLNQVQQLPREERHEALQEILAGAHTRLAEAYDALDTNMKMAFWYRLANSHRGDILVPKSPSQDSRGKLKALLADLSTRDSNELVSFLREAVSHRSIA